MSFYPNSDRSQPVSTLEIHVKIKPNFRNTCKNKVIL